MSLIDDFKSSLPLTPKLLESFLNIIIEKLDSITPYTIDGEMIESLLALNQGVVVTSTITLSTFDAIYEAVCNNKNLKIDFDDQTSNIDFAYHNEVAGDDYKSIVLGFFMKDSGAKRIYLELESVSGSIRMATKAVTSL